jgi:hypothetical protein
MVAFRNLTVSPDQPVELWTTEGVLSALERGSLKDWRRLSRAVQAEPHGVVAEELVEAIEVTESRGVATAMLQSCRMRGCLKLNALPDGFEAVSDDPD